MIINEIRKGTPSPKSRKAIMVWQEHIDLRLLPNSVALPSTDEKQNPATSTKPYLISSKGIDLYGGTRHSTVTELNKILSPEQIRKLGTLHNTNKAFDRYLRIEFNDSKIVYQLTRDLNTLKKKKNKYTKVKL